MNIFKRKKASDQLYCSVDLEFTGFDPSHDQILEIGFAFFRITPHGVEITEQWSQVFKPSMEVHPKILGLTGITLEELDAASEFNEHREFLQSKLGDCIIVAHNPTMDVKFLESYGIKLSGKTIDTLELVQFLLPTHHSYNLENLMHYFDIQHQKSHRALDDCLSTIAVLENLLRIYGKFSDDLKASILQVCSRASFLWEPLLSISLPKRDVIFLDSLPQTSHTELVPFQISEQIITIDEHPLNHEMRVVLGLANTNQQTVLVVEENGMVMRLWKAKLAQGIFSTEDLFDTARFENFLAQASTPEELRFCLKILVWQSTNWQTETILDLNISFFGGQYRQYISGGLVTDTKSQVIVCSYRTFSQQASTGMFKDRKAVICNMQGFEKFISSGNGTHASWNSLLYSLKLVYNPETEFGAISAKEEVIHALIGVDLFFALVYMLLHRVYSQAKYVSLERVESEQNYIYNKIVESAKNLRKKLEMVEAKTQTKDLHKFIAFLETIFLSSPERVRWVVLDEDNTSLHGQPINVADLAQKLLQQCGSYAFTETLADEELLLFHSERLGLNTVINIFNSKIENFGLANLELHASSLQSENLVKLLLEQNTSTVVVMKDLSSIKDFYNAHFVELKKHAPVFAQGYSGGGNKMFRNFSIKSNSILLATAEFIAKQSYELAPGLVVFTQLPSVDDSHPYTEALINHWQTQFPNIKKLLLLHKAIEVLKN